MVALATYSDFAQIFSLHLMHLARDKMPAYCYRRRSVVCVSVYVGHVREPCKNG